jgi:hypothetical protein
MTRARVLGAALAAALVLAAPAAADPGCPGADSVVGAQDAGALAGPTLCLLNAERRAAGLRPVAGQQKLARTPGMITLPSGSFTSSTTVHSCSWRGLAASNEIAAGRASITTSMMSRSATSRWCGPS